MRWWTKWPQLSHCWRQELTRPLFNVRHLLHQRYKKLQEHWSFSSPIQCLVLKMFRGKNSGNSPEEQGYSQNGAMREVKLLFPVLCHLRWSALWFKCPDAMGLHKLPGRGPFCSLFFLNPECIPNFQQTSAAFNLIILMVSREPSLFLWHILYLKRA